MISDVAVSPSSESLTFLPTWISVSLPRPGGDDGARHGDAGFTRLGGDLAGQQLPGDHVLDPADVLEIDPAVLLLQREAFLARA